MKIDRLQFNKPADTLIEAVELYLTERGERVDRKKVLKICNEVLEARK